MRSCTSCPLWCTFSSYLFIYSRVTSLFFSFSNWLFSCLINYKECYTFFSPFCACFTGLLLASESLYFYNCYIRLVF